MDKYDDILDDISESLITTDDFVGTHLRFRNFMIDSFVISIPFCFLNIVLLILGINLSFFSHYKITLESNIISYILISVIIIIYYTISEYYLEGKTIGKFITNTRAVTLDNQTMDFNTTLMRSFCRVIPFEIISFLGYLPSGWHDRWTGTKVISDTTKEETPKSMNELPRPRGYGVSQTTKN